MVGSAARSGRANRAALAVALAAAAVLVYVQAGTLRDNAISLAADAARVVAQTKLARVLPLAALVLVLGSVLCWVLLAMTWRPGAASSSARPPLRAPVGRIGPIGSAPGRAQALGPVMAAAPPSVVQRVNGSKAPNGWARTPEPALRQVEQAKTEGEQRARSAEERLSRLQLQHKQAMERLQALEDRLSAAAAAPKHARALEESAHRLVDPERRAEYAERLVAETNDAAAANADQLAAAEELTRMADERSRMAEDPGSPRRGARGDRRRTRRRGRAPGQRGRSPGGDGDPGQLLYGGAPKGGTGLILMILMILMSRLAQIHRGRSVEDRPNGGGAFRIVVPHASETDGGGAARLTLEDGAIAI